ncbi:HK97 gp10 family phage protein [Planococcus sp. SIMBA_143]
MGKIEGLDEFLDFTNSLTDEIESDVKELVKKTAYQTEGAAKNLTPVDTGRLRRSISTKTENGGLSATVSTNVEYAMAVEYGTSKQPAQPYMTPAYVKYKKKFEDGMLDIMRKVSD